MVYTFNEFFALIGIINCEGVSQIIQLNDDETTALRIVENNYVEYGYMSGDVLVPKVKLLKIDTLKAVHITKEVDAEIVEEGHYLKVDLNFEFVNTDREDFCLWPFSVGLEKKDHDWLATMMERYASSLPICNDKSFIRQCKRCGKYFIASNKKKVYCDQVDSSGRRCSDKGPRERYQVRLDTDEALQAYRKAYNRYASRMKYGSIDKMSFRNWAADAKTKLGSTRRGEMELSAFKNWLQEFGG